jgi:hypothetical protein
MKRKTVKIIIEGEVEMVELVAASMRAIFQVAEESRNMTIHLRPSDIRRTMRILPLSDPLEDKVA